MAKIPAASHPEAPTYFPPVDGAITTNDGTKHVQPLTSQSKCAIAAFIVVGIVGVVLMSLGFTDLFGSVGNIASISGGGIAEVIAMIGLICIAISNRKQSDSNQESDYRFPTIPNASLQTPETKEDQAMPPLSDIAFGAARWKEFYKIDIVEPPLPKNIETRLKEPCPFIEGKQVWQSHCLFLVPGSFRWSSLPSLAPGVVRLCDEDLFDDTDDPLHVPRQTLVKDSHWVLMLKEPVPNSLGIPHVQSIHENRDKKNYILLPTILDVTVAILTHYTWKNERLFPATEIFCAEKGRKGQMRIGQFDTKGLHVNRSDGDMQGENRAIGALIIL